jgi:hypothetical protein
MPVFSALDRIYALEVDGLDALVNRIVFLDFRGGSQVLGATVRQLIVCVPEARAPVAEVRGDDKEVCWVSEVRSELGAEIAFGGGVGRAD